MDKLSAEAVMAAELGNAQELLQEFEAQSRAQCGGKQGRSSWELC